MNSSSFRLANNAAWMIMSLFDQAVNQELAPRLRAAGFVRHGQTWNRRSDGVVQVISIQRSQNNTELDSRFTVNIGVTPDFGSSDRAVRHYDCRRRERIGFLRPDHRDHWYRYLPKDDTSVRSAVAEARADIEAYALPYLASPFNDCPSALTAAAYAPALARSWKWIDKLSQKLRGLWPFR
jgi:hypothetical protein